MKRRTFIAGLGSAAAWPMVARGQQPTMPVIGFLSSRWSADSASVVAAFQQGLQEAGLDSQNFSIDYRWAEGEFDRLSAMAVELATARVAAIAAFAPPAGLLPKQLDRKRLI
jgi:putative ABC transport system substrate-binding protein